MKKIPLALGGFVLGRMAYRKIVESTYSYQGKVVLLTGGSRGLGLVMARQLIKEGARVAVLARDPDRLDGAAKEFSPEEFFTVSCDLTKPSEIKLALSKVLAHYKKLDVLIHNAGVIQVGSFENMTPGDYRQSLDTHFWGGYYLITSALGELSRSEAPRIILVDSIGGQFGVPHLAPYCTGKFALAGFAQSIQPELDNKGIKLTIAYPSLMRTGSPYHALFKGKSQDERFWFTLLDSLPVIAMPAERAARMILNAGRAGRPEVIPGALGYVAIKASHLTPTLFSQIMRLTQKLLPKAKTEGRVGSGMLGYKLPDDPRLETPAVLTHLAALQNNEL